MKQLQPSKGLAFAFLIVAFLGFLDAAYLTIEHYRGVPPACSFLEGCEEVTTSEYATVFGFPVALGGALYYLAVFLLAAGFFIERKPILITVAAYLTPLGLLASLWFLYLQFFVIHALCIYCLASAVTSTTLFILAIMMARQHCRS